MQLRTLLQDDGAVSPVIGVILMVAITVILAAVIGTFVLGLGGQVSQTAPQASISVQSVDTPGNTVTLKHGGSDSLTADETNIKVSVNDSASFTAEGGNDAKFSTADTIDISTGDDATTASITGWAGSWSFSGDDTDFNVGNGQTMTITFIDTPSGQVIADKTVDL